MELILLLKEASSDSTKLRSWFRDKGLIEELSKGLIDRISFKERVIMMENSSLYKKLKIVFKIK